MVELNHQPNNPLSAFAGSHYLDFLQMGVMVVDSANRVVYWNRWLEEHSNIKFEQILHLTFTEAFPELVNSRLAEVIHQAMDENLSSIISASLNHSLLPLYPTTNHQLRQIDLMRQTVQVTPIIGENGKAFALLQITNMTHALAKDAQLLQQSQALHQLNYIDHLTSVANRKKFDEVLLEEFRRAQRADASLVLGFVEVDYFKLFNEHYGESYGDQCLSEVAATFEYALNRSTDFVGRYQAQTFGVIMPCTTFDGAVNVAEVIREGINDLQLRHEASVVAGHVTVSMGLATLQPSMNHQLEEFTRAAEFALAQAKQAGGNKAMIYSMHDGNLHACDAIVNVKKLKFVEA